MEHLGITFCVFFHKSTNARGSEKTIGLWAQPWQSFLNCVSCLECVRYPENWWELRMVSKSAPKGWGQAWPSPISIMGCLPSTSSTGAGFLSQYVEICWSILDLSFTVCSSWSNSWSPSFCDHSHGVHGQQVAEHGLRFGDRAVNWAVVDGGFFLTDLGVEKQGRNLWISSFIIQCETPSYKLLYKPQ